MNGSDLPTMVTVYETHDPLLTPVLKSLLEAEGIPCFVLNEFTQDLIGGRFLLGFNPLLGPMKIEVEAAHAEAARELIAHHIDTLEVEDAAGDETPN